MDSYTVVLTLVYDFPEDVGVAAQLCVEESEAPFFKEGVEYRHEMAASPEGFLHVYSDTRLTQETVLDCIMSLIQTFRSA